MTARTYQELRSYSILDDCTVARISMTDDQHQEFFMLVPERDPTGVMRRHAPLRRVLRAAACEAIEEAMDARLAPGEVRVAPEAWRDMVAEHFAEQIRERAE